MLTAQFISLMFIVVVLFVVNTWSFPGVSVFLIGPGIGFMLLGKIFMPIIHLKTQNNTKTPNPIPWLASRSPSSERNVHRQECAGVKLGRVHMDVDGSQLAFSLVQL